MRKIIPLAKSSMASKPIPKIATYASRSMVLQSPTQPISLTSRRLPDIIKHLRNLACEVGTCSLSANQINYPYSVFACLNPSKLVSNQWVNYEDLTPEDYNIIINPKIVTKSPIEQYMYQQCVSIYGFRFPILRPSLAVFEYSNEKGQEIVEVKKGFQGRVWQHQTSHFQGKLLLQTDVCHDQFELADDFTTTEMEQQLLKLKHAKAQFDAQKKKQQQQLKQQNLRSNRYNRVPSQEKKQEGQRVGRRVK